jgi:hypothetical protein
MPGFNAAVKGDAMIYFPFMVLQAYRCNNHCCRKELVYPNLSLHQSYLRLLVLMNLETGITKILLTWERTKEDGLNMPTLENFFQHK